MAAGKKQGALIFLVVLVLAVFLAMWAGGFYDYISIENIKEKRDLLRRAVDENYPLAVAAYILIYAGTAFIIPGALPLTLLGGFLFGGIEAAAYVNVAATTGASISFLLARYAIGNRLQRRYAGGLQSFNRELERNGSRYLLALRIIPLFPFFLVNYFAGLTRIPFRTFLWTTSLGIMPGSLVYAIAGQQLGTIESVRDLYTAKILVPLALMAALILIPAALTYKRGWRRADHG